MDNEINMVSPNETKRNTTVVSFVSIKGGVGKTHIAILIALYLAAAGRKILVLDTDLNNSMSYYFFGGGTDKFKIARGGKNICTALGNEDNDLKDFVIETKTKGIDLIASSAYLADMRTINEKRLGRMMATVKGYYDVVIIDCHPTYDNLVLNAIHASDYIISPALRDSFSLNAAEYLNSALKRDTDKFGNWGVIINGYDRRFDKEGSKQSAYTDEYKAFPLLPKHTWLPWTAYMHDAIDFGQKVTAAKQPALFNAIANLGEGFASDGLLPVVEAF